MSEVIEGILSFAKVYLIVGGVISLSIFGVVAFFIFRSFKSMNKNFK